MLVKIYYTRNILQWIPLRPEPGIPSLAGLKSRQGLAMLCGEGGVIVLFAVPGPDNNVVVPINDFWMKEITIITSYYCGHSDIKEALKIIEWRSIVVDDLTTHRLPLTDIVKGLQLVTDGRESIKVIIKPNEHKVAK